MMKWSTVAIVASAIGVMGLALLVSRVTNPVQSDEPELLMNQEKAEVAVEEAVLAKYYYPMANYQNRITNRGHGKSTTLADSEGFACGGQFEGIHVGDDLEVVAEELEKEVPVYAIADGTVRQRSIVGGYGGLLIIEHDIEGQIVTAYYGHVDISKATSGVGDQVKAGQLLTYLGDDCSSETSDERKHLHFSIRRGTDIDVRGYLQNRAELAEWLDPKALLAASGASEPPTN